MKLNQKHKQKLCIVQNGGVALRSLQFEILSKHNVYRSAAQ